MQIRVTNDKGTFDASQLIVSARWSGDYQQAARSLDFSLLSSPTDTSIPVVDCPLGAGVQLLENGEVLFDGFVTSRSRTTDAHVIDVSCFDRGYYLKRNKGFYKFTEVTPEAIVQQLAGDFGFALGDVAQTGINLSRLFISGNDTLYDILVTVYTLAAQTTGQQYHIGFRGAKLFVTVKEPDERTLVLKGGSNLIAASTTESLDDLVSTVQVYDQNDNLVRTLEDNERLKLYGRMQEIVKQTQDDDKAAEAQKKLDDGDVTQKITVESLGNLANVTGGTVIVQEPHTGLQGLFYIDNDIHEWKRGQYYNKLVLNYKSIVNEKEAGSLPQ